MESIFPKWKLLTKTKIYELWFVNTSNNTTTFSISLNGKLTTARLNVGVNMRRR